MVVSVTYTTTSMGSVLFWPFAFVHNMSHYGLLLLLFFFFLFSGTVQDNGEWRVTVSPPPRCPVVYRFVRGFNYNLEVKKSHGSSIVGVM